jgi:EAL domain-containing protein (putative c-di-GMP-specific phosphodiesterase class I)
MDDFGTGYSSLAYLRRLPIDQLKLDRTFVTEIDERGGGAPVLRAAVAMAHALEVEVVAEGVETFQQVGVLRSLDYQLVQGFYFARPLAEVQIAEWLRETRPPEDVRRLRVVGGGPAAS